MGGREEKGQKGGKKKGRGDVDAEGGKGGNREVFFTFVSDTVHNYYLCAKIPSISGHR